MIRSLAYLLPAALLALGSQAVHAQTGHDESILKQVIAANSGGTCPDTLMAPYLRGMCLQAMPGAGQKLTSLGAINNIDYLGTQVFPNVGPCEIYRVTFANGALVWTINVGPDGKIAFLSFN